MTCSACERFMNILCAWCRELARKVTGSRRACSGSSFALSRFVHEPTCVKIEAFFAQATTPWSIGSRVQMASRASCLLRCFEGLTSNHIGEPRSW